MWLYLYFLASIHFLNVVCLFMTFSVFVCFCKTMTLKCFTSKPFFKMALLSVKRSRKYYLRPHHPEIVFFPQNFITFDYTPTSLSFSFSQRKLRNIHMFYGFKILIPDSFTYKMEGLAVVPTVTDFRSVLQYGTSWKVTGTLKTCLKRSKNVHTIKVIYREGVWLPSAVIQKLEP